MYETTVNMKVVGKFETFKDAFKCLYTEVMEQLKNGYSWQLLETTVWIDDTDSPSLPTMFYKARDYACDQGWVVDGKLVI